MAVNTKRGSASILQKQFSALNIDKASSSATKVCLCQTAQQHIPEGNNLEVHLLTHQWQ